jgi:hypothetical protein
LRCADERLHLSLGFTVANQDGFAGLESGLDLRWIGDGCDAMSNSEGKKIREPDFFRWTGQVVNFQDAIANYAASGREGWSEEYGPRGECSMRRQNFCANGTAASGVNFLEEKAGRIGAERGSSLGDDTGCAPGRKRA